MQTTAPTLSSSLARFAAATVALLVQTACFLPPSQYASSSTTPTGSEPPRYATVDCAATRFCGPGEICAKVPGEIYKQCLPGPNIESKGCTTDLECGYGKACVKGVGDYHGFCAQRVNATGGQSYAPAPPPRYGTSYTPDCHYDFDCGVLFRCSDGRCIKR